MAFLFSGLILDYYFRIMVQYMKRSKKNNSRDKD